VTRHFSVHGFSKLVPLSQYLNPWHSACQANKVRLDVADIFDRTRWFVILAGVRASIGKCLAKNKMAYQADRSGKMS
jgi:hypothetical protein